ncbi:hypothetical protein MLD38_036868 [Melastoma candidum]|uniref:Uncharacterized protein n=1 Tax=Melastoma candidum TaxID=119954 RepID=A0ACB9LL28_9MYRT|nr:hypothetical protein MLD38_036868 [Melastoma candidum]
MLTLSSTPFVEKRSMKGFKTNCDGSSLQNAPVLKEKDPSSAICSGHARFSFSSLHCCTAALCTLFRLQCPATHMKLHLLVEQNPKATTDHLLDPKLRHPFLIPWKYFISFLMRAPIVPWVPTTRPPLRGSICNPILLGFALPSVEVLYIWSGLKKEEKPGLIT